MGKRANVRIDSERGRSSSKSPNVAIGREAWSTWEQETEERVMLEEVGPGIDEARMSIKKSVSKL
jgi:hypothetical protein